ncbi:MurR/RpiR family transcriptional regulator [Cohaesibacter celericrescens]|uniref:MurR/RpiR family transcriptional regulator n=1 Tax=Cohaesibacter celericrescens TaxID=2067669 RepID=A0A2N5XTW2_9HYPH|nr:MurR/RpiR family transcriptional regulator [Cohaesibacter celericrescens]PLW77848.1 MurR/RpiR family transcriptional regulator [Cohaesibacter celericrescens]
MTAKGLVKLQDRVAAHYGDMSQRLRQAADYVVAHELDVATHSLRTVSGKAKMAPATFTRLSQALGFSSYEDMRDLCRESVGRQALTFSQRAERLAREHQGDAMPSFFDRQMSASLDNLNQLSGEIDQDMLLQVVETLNGARDVLLFGAFSSTGLVEYFAYLARYFANNWKVAGRMGASLSSAMVGLDETDAVIILTKGPYAKRSILAAKMASASGAYVIVITDKHSCPALEFSSAHFIVPTESPQFFSSYAATLVLIETLVGMLVVRAGEQARIRIEDVETRNRQYGEFWE